MQSIALSQILSFQDFEIPVFRVSAILSFLDFEVPRFWVSPNFEIFLDFEFPRIWIFSDYEFPRFWVSRILNFLDCGFPISTSWRENQLKPVGPEYPFNQKPISPIIAHYVGFPQCFPKILWSVCLTFEIELSWNISSKYLVMVIILIIADFNFFAPATMKMHAVALAPEAALLASLDNLSVYSTTRIPEVSMKWPSWIYRIMYSTVLAENSHGYNEPGLEQSFIPCAMRSRRADRCFIISTRWDGARHAGTNGPWQYKQQDRRHKPNITSKKVQSRQAPWTSGTRTWDRRQSMSNNHFKTFTLS